LNFILFFILFDSFKKENESEKEKKDWYSKPIFQISWLA
jgi:hypothetical protein